MSERPIRPTGPLTIGDPSQVLGDMPEQGEFQRPQRRGGGGWIAAVIVLLVLLTGAGLFFLRAYELKKEARETQTPSTQVTPPATPPSTPAPAIAPADDKGEKKAAVAPVPPPVAPTVKDQPKRDEPKVTPLAPEPKEPVKKAQAPKPSHHHHEHAAPKDEPVSLPHLPKPPPTTDDN